MSAAKSTGGPAFPSNRDMRNSPDWDYEPGMTLRDYFAAQAMHALLTIDGTTYFKNRAAAAYAMADAMLEEGQK